MGAFHVCCLSAGGSRFAESHVLYTSLPDHWCCRGLPDDCRVAASNVAASDGTASDGTASDGTASDGTANAFSIFSAGEHCSLCVEQHIASCMCLCASTARPRL